MTENELNVLGVLYDHPDDRNATDEIITRQLGITPAGFEVAVKSLLDSGYVLEITNSNQRNEGLKAYAITVNGAKRWHFRKRNPLESFERFGKWFSTIALLLGVGFSINSIVQWHRDFNISNTSLQIQSKALHIQTLEYMHSLKTPNTSHQEDKASTK